MAAVTPHQKSTLSIAHLNRKQRRGMHGRDHNKSWLGKTFLFLARLQCLSHRKCAAGSRGQKRQRQRDKWELNWPEEATAVKTEGLVTNSASMLIAIQTSLLCGERRLNPIKEKQTCYSLLKRKKRRTMARETNSENIKYKIQSNPIHCSCIHVISARLILSLCSS